MKNKSWIIILIMGIALTISIAYSIVVSNQKKKPGTSTVTTTSIVEMTASTVTIKNTLTGIGKIEYIKKPEDNNIETLNGQNIVDETLSTSVQTEEPIKTYQILLSIEDKDLNKAKIDQDVEISVKNETEILNYIGKVIKINKDVNNKSTIDIEITNPNDALLEGMQATCTVIIEKAENVVALPVEAVQKTEDGKEYVDVVQPDGTTTQIYIKTGLSDDYYVEITSGLNVGDRVQIIKTSTTVVNEKNDSISEK